MDASIGRKVKYIITEQPYKGSQVFKPHIWSLSETGNLFWRPLNSLFDHGYFMDIEDAREEISSEIRNTTRVIEEGEI